MGAVQMFLQTFDIEGMVGDGEGGGLLDYLKLCQLVWLAL